LSAAGRSPATPDAEPTAEERAARLARELDAAFQARGRLYWELYATLREARGAAEAERLLALAIERRGRAAGAALFGPLAGAPPQEIAAHFLRVASPDWGRLFPHDYEPREDGSVTIRVRRCPLQDAWRADGRTPEEVALMCRIAGRADHGVFGAAGCAFAAETWEPGREGCCVLHLSPR
jgi:hypothetical protein